MFDRRFPLGAPDLPLSRTFDPSTGAVALWFADRVELRAPGGRTASLALDRAVAQWVSDAASTAYPCSPGADACFAAASQDSLLRVHWSYANGPILVEQPLPPESHRLRRATPSLALQGGARAGYVLLRFAGALNPGFSLQSPSVVTCSLERCELGSCAGARPPDLAPLDNLPGPFFTTEEGLRSLTADAQVMTLDLDRPAEPRCSPLAQPQFLLEADEIVPIDSVQESLRTPAGEIFAVVRGPDRTSLIHASSERELSDGGARARIGREGDAAGLSPHRFDPEMAQLRVTRGGLFLVGRETLEFVPRLSDLGTPTPLVWPAGARTVDRGASGWLVDTHLGLEWLRSDGEKERLWGIEGDDSLRSEIGAVLAGDELVLTQSELEDGSLSLMRPSVDSSSVQVQNAGVQRGVLAPTAEAGFVRNLRHLEPLRMEMDRLHLDSGALETSELDLSNLGLRDEVRILAHRYLGEGVSLIVLRTLEDGLDAADAVVLWAPDTGLMLVDPSMERGIVLESSGSLGSIWGGSNTSLYWLGTYRNADGSLGVRTRHIREAELAAAAELGGSNWYFRSRSTGCRGSLHTLLRGTNSTRHAEFDLTASRLGPAAPTLLSPLTAKGTLEFLDAGRAPWLYYDASSRLVFTSASSAPVAALPTLGSVVRASGGRLSIVSPAGDVFVERR